MGQIDHAHEADTTARPSVAIGSAGNGRYRRDPDKIDLHGTIVLISATFCIVQTGEVLRELRLRDQIADLLLEGGRDTVVRLDDIEVAFVVTYGDENALHQVMRAAVDVMAPLGESRERPTFEHAVTLSKMMVPAF